MTFKGGTTVHIWRWIGGDGMVKHDFFYIFFQNGLGFFER